MPTAITLIDGTMRIFRTDFPELLDRLQDGVTVLLLHEGLDSPIVIPLSAVLSIRPEEVPKAGPCPPADRLADGSDGAAHTRPA
jgi:hypothetical protein